MKSLASGRQVHANLLKTHVKPSIISWNNLMNMYAKYGCLKAACEIFDRMLAHNVFSWTIIITGYAQDGGGTEALQLFMQMQQEGVLPDKVTFVSCVSACAMLQDLANGKLVHSNVLKCQCDSHNPLVNNLINMYCRCGNTQDARNLFDLIPVHDVVSWSTMIAGYAQHGQGREALKLPQHMQLENIKMNNFVLSGLLIACSAIASVSYGKWVHCHVLQSGSETDSILSNGLVDMYAKCGSIFDSCIVFDRLSIQDVVSWTAIIVGFDYCCDSKEGIKLFQQMQQVGIEPNEITFQSIMCACANEAALGQGKFVHTMILKAKVVLEHSVGNALINMYVECQSMRNACKVFDQLSERDVVSWSAMIAGSIHFDQKIDVLKIFKYMDLENVEPSLVTYITTVNVCAFVGNFELGRNLHAKFIESGQELDLFLGNSFIDMYAKCGSLESALQVFGKLALKDVISWTAMIAGYMHHGRANDALHFFALMQEAGMKPEEATFTSILSACSHSRLVDEGFYHLGSITQVYADKPITKHYACLIDLLGRAGFLAEAEDLLNTMPLEPSIEMHTCFLSACRLCDNIDLAEHTVTTFRSWGAAGFCLLSNIYSLAGKSSDIILE